MMGCIPTLQEGRCHERQRANTHPARRPVHHRDNRRAIRAHHHRAYSRALIASLTNASPRQAKYTPDARAVSSDPRLDGIDGDRVPPRPHLQQSPRPSSWLRPIPRRSCSPAPALVPPSWEPASSPGTLHSRRRLVTCRRPTRAHGGCHSRDHAPVQAVSTELDTIATTLTSCARTSRRSPDSSLPRKPWAHHRGIQRAQAAPPS